MKNVGVNRTPLARALATSSSTRALARSSAAAELGLVRRQVRADAVEVLLGELLGARHQRDVRVPELLRSLRTLDELRSAASDVAAGDGPVPENVSQPLSKLVADLGDSLVRRATVGTVVAAVLDERDGRLLRSEHVIARRVYGPIETVREGGGVGQDGIPGNDLPLRIYFGAQGRI